MTDAHNAAMVRAMVTLAHDLNLRVVAEGIENESELSFLKQLSCDFGQGYFFARPQSATVAQSLLFSAGTMVPAASLPEPDLFTANQSTMQ
jgi:EAL domain-containing protein (putative c-di-GMP-specific phosphodiesterase class I)